MIARHIAWMAGAILLAVSTIHADTIHVDVANCPGPGDGSAGDPYCSIQTALGNAVNTDEIVVAPGTYFETINFLGKAVSLRSSDGPAVTIINGQQSGSVVTCASGEGSDTVLDGFRVTGGNGTVGDPFTLGGGMYNQGASPTVNNCIFSGNSIVPGGGGGGMYNVNSSPLVTNCSFIGNTAALAGGMYNVNSSPTVADCTFLQNSGELGGGMTNQGGSPTVTNCSFAGNSSIDVGGGMYNPSGSPTVTNCSFTGNSSHSGGGMNSSATNLAVTSCTFRGNNAEFGGGMTTQGASPTVTNSTFVANTALDQGGGMYSFQGSPTVTGCTFAGNWAVGGGGGMYNFAGSPRVTNCILWDDSPNEIHADSGDPIVTYCNVQGSYFGIGNIDAAPLFVDSAGGDYRISPGSPCIDAGDNTAVPEGITTDLDGNPRFLEIPETPDTGNGTLPIVDMGAYESLGGGCLAVTSQQVVCHADGTTFTVNIEGLNACTGGTTQVTFTASGGAVGEELCFLVAIGDGGLCCFTQICVTIPDCSPAALPSDLDGDGIVGMVDFLALLAAWGSCSDCGTCPADFDGDCSVGILDLLILLGNWG